MQATPPASSWRSRAPVDDVEPLLLAALDAAAAPALAAFRAPPRPDRKRDGSLVSAVDRQAEQVLVDALLTSFPGYGILGEEGARRDAEPGAPVWLIDPLDGTSAWLEGLAHWGPVVAAHDAEGVLAGAMLLPRIDELWYFHRARGAFRDRQALVRDPDPPPSRPLLAGSAMLQHLRVDWRGRRRNLGSTASHLALVAAGGASAALVGPGWGPWDTALGLALIDATGGASACLGAPSSPAPAGAPSPRGAVAARQPEFVEQSGSGRLPTASRVHPMRDAGQPFVAGRPDAVARLLRPGALRPIADPS